MRYISMMIFVFLLAYLGVESQDNACPVLPEMDITCDINTACDIAGEIILQNADGDVLSQTVDVPLESVRRIMTVAGDDVQSAVMIQQEDWSAIPFGETSLEFVGTPTISVTVKSPNTINVRSAPNSSASLVTTAESGSKLIADGRNVAGDWLRVQLSDGGVGWIAGFLLKADESVDVLPVLHDLEPTYALQDAWYFLSQPIKHDDPCRERLNGMFAQSRENQLLSLQVNGTTLKFDGTVLLEAEASGRLTINVLEGVAVLEYSDRRQVAVAGIRLRVRLDADGMATGILSLPAPVEIEEVIPVTLLPRIVEIPAGIPRSESKDAIARTLECLAVPVSSVNARSGPGQAYPTARFLDANEGYLVSGVAEDSGGIRWWRIDDVWVREDVVTTAGRCNLIPTITNIPDPPERELESVRYDSFQMGNNWCGRPRISYVEGDRILFQMYVSGFTTFEEGVAAQNGSTPSIVLDGVPLDPLNVSNVDKSSFSAEFYNFGAEYMWVAVAGDHTVVGTWTGLATTTCSFTVEPPQS